MRRNKKGFTLIELIVVIAVLGILVLLAAPRFLGYTADAKEAQIKADIKTVETHIGAKLAENMETFDHWENVDKTTMEQRRNDEKLMSKEGLVRSDKELNGEYSLIHKEDLPKTKLKGDFIYEKGGQVYYYDKNLNVKPSDKDDSGTSPGGTELIPGGEYGTVTGDTGKPPVIELEPEPVIADHYTPTDEKWFEFTADNNNPDAYSVPGYAVKGYYRYTGYEETVVIPETIKGYPLTSYHRMFNGSNANIKKVVSTNKNITNMSYMFYMSNSTSLDLSDFYTSNVTDMKYMFYTAAKLTSLDMSSFRTSKVTDMSHMFYSTVKLNSLDLSGFNTKNVESMAHMFFGSAVKNLDVSSFDTSKVENMQSMFNQTKGTSINLGKKFNTSNVTNMRLMFYEQKNITSLDVSMFDTSKVTNMNQMFDGVSGLTTLNLENFNTSNVTDMGRMFAGLNLTNINISKFDTSNVTTMSGMFSGSKIDNLDISHFNTSKVNSMSSMFSGYKNTTIDLSNFNVTNVTDMSSMFAKSSLTNLNLINFNPTNLTDATLMFENSVAKVIDVSKIDFTNTRVSSAFSNATTEIVYVKNQDSLIKFNSGTNKPQSVKVEIK